MTPQQKGLIFPLRAAHVIPALVACHRDICCG
jgi:hypothetical protein